MNSDVPINESTQSSSLKLLSSTREKSGNSLQRFSHWSESNQCDMIFSIYIPDDGVGVAAGTIPAIYFLCGLKSTDENFTRNAAGAFPHAATSRVALIVPDTNARGHKLSAGASYYVDAIEERFAKHYRMATYITKELPDVIQKNFPAISPTVKSIMGHSMGGHGALITYLRNPGLYQSVSAFSPVCNPCVSPLGTEGLSGYLGNDRQQWKQWDATELVKTVDSDYHNKPWPTSTSILIEMGDEDPYLLGGELLPDHLLTAAKNTQFKITYNLRPGFGHAMADIVSTFVESHILFHASYLHKAMGHSIDSKDDFKQGCNPLVK